MSTPSQKLGLIEVILFVEGSLESRLSIRVRRCVRDRMNRAFTFYRNKVPFWDDVTIKKDDTTLYNPSLTPILVTW